MFRIYVKQYRAVGIVSSDRLGGLVFEKLMEKGFYFSQSCPKGL
jgi:hypothetical protein